ncbi:MAG TPA: methylated-DNA--[protein]-cysteine S-methyltransferase [Methanomicrobia archaeon]|nr:methylated-DNA--[protein]-cysteine S-methyltransferase [Methanomicrobia archaeon]
MCRRLLANPVIQDYEIEVVARNCEDFQNAVWNLTQKIPKGRVTTYGEISRKITGSESAARAVGQALAKNPKPGSGEGEIPCHRVVKKGGEVGEGVKNQIDLLRKEGVTINKETKKGGKVVNFKDVFFPAKGEKW